MDTNKKLQIIEELNQAEETEDILIELYSTLMDLGVENCIKPELKEEFLDGMQTLRNDSKKHKSILDNLIDQYE